VASGYPLKATAEEKHEKGPEAQPKNIIIVLYCNNFDKLDFSRIVPLPTAGSFFYFF
jgi:hypothetical protein